MVFIIGQLKSPSSVSRRCYFPKPRLGEIIVLHKTFLVIALNKNYSNYPIKRFWKLIGQIQIPDLSKMSRMSNIISRFAV